MNHWISGELGYIQYPTVQKSYWLYVVSPVFGEIQICDWQELLRG